MTFPGNNIHPTILVLGPESQLSLEKGCSDLEAFSAQNLLCGDNFP